MASNKRSTKRRPTRPVQGNANGPRRLGGQAPPPQRSASAQRRYERSRRSRRSSGLTAWLGVLLVVAVVLAFAIYKLTEHTPASSKNGSNLALVPASVLSELKSIPASTFSTGDTAKTSDPFTETAKQPFIRLGGKPHVIYVGAEYCPYCAVTRWALVVSLSRFGTFTNLHQTTSSADFAPIPTFSFVGSKYTSKYITFTPYEEEDRNGNTLEVPPKSILTLVALYDGTATKASKFNASGSTGIPFIDVANQHVSSGAPAILDNSIPDVAGGGPGGFNGIAYAIAHPTSVTGKAIKAYDFIAVANYDIAEICNVDGGKPGSVCQMSGVKAAAKVIAAQKKLS
jgi:thiol-disulfide isomerase/thioredoxin